MASLARREPLLCATSGSADLKIAPRICANRVMTAIPLPILLSGGGLATPRTSAAPSNITLARRPGSSASSGVRNQTRQLPSRKTSFLFLSTHLLATSAFEHYQAHGLFLSLFLSMN